MEHSIVRSFHADTDIYELTIFENIFEEHLNLELDGVKQDKVKCQRIWATSGFEPQATPSVVISADRSRCGRLLTINICFIDQTLYHF